MCSRIVRTWAFRVRSDWAVDVVVRARLATRFEHDLLRMALVMAFIHFLSLSKCVEIFSPR